MDQLPGKPGQTARSGILLLADGFQRGSGKDGGRLRTRSPSARRNRTETHHEPDGHRPDLQQRECAHGRDPEDVDPGTATVLHHFQRRRSLRRTKRRLDGSAGSEPGNLILLHAQRGGYNGGRRHRPADPPVPGRKRRVQLPLRYGRGYGQPHRPHPGTDGTSGRLSGNPVRDTDCLRRRRTCPDPAGRRAESSLYGSGTAEIQHGPAAAAEHQP